MAHVAGAIVHVTNILKNTSLSTILDDFAIDSDDSPDFAPADGARSAIAVTQLHLPLLRTAATNSNMPTGHKDMRGSVVHTHTALNDFIGGGAAFAGSDGANLSRIRRRQAIGRRFFIELAPGYPEAERGRRSLGA